MDQSWDQDNYSNSQPLTVPPRIPRIPSTNSPPRSRRHDSSNRNSEIRLVYEEIRELKKRLSAATSQFQAEAVRATEAEHQVQQVTAHLKRVNDARITAQQEAARANEELK
jgi:hypothetical protein